MSTTVRLTDLKAHTDLNRGGTLVPIELKDVSDGFQNSPRVYYITSEEFPVLKRRGGHHHHKEEEIMTMARGNALFVLDEPGKPLQSFILDSKKPQALYIPPNVWHTITMWSKDAILLVIASQNYDPNDSFLCSHKECKSIKEEKR